jgi:hypothetical protein
MFSEFGKTENSPRFSRLLAEGRQEARGPQARGLNLIMTVEKLPSGLYIN